MKRTAILHCADTDLGNFNNLLSRNQVEFQTAMGGEVEQRRYAKYTLHNAFLLRLTLDLIGAGADTGLSKHGLSPSLAGKAVKLALGEARAKGIDVTAPGTFAGVAIMEEVQPDGTALRFTRWFCNDILELPKWRADTEKREAEGFDGVTVSTVCLFLVNTARAAAFVRQRAEDMGLPEAAEDLNASKV